MDDQRLAQPVSQLDLRLEGALLIGGGCVVAVVVKAGLPDRHAAGVGSERLEVGQLGVIEARGLVGVAADRRVDLGKGVGGRQRLAVGLRVGTDGHDPCHPRLKRRLHQLGVRRLARVQVRVAIDHA